MDRPLATGTRPGRLKRLPSQALYGLMDLLLPEQCRQCGAACADGGYCTVCRTALKRHEHQCPVCGVPFHAGGICGRCQRHPPLIVETIAPFVYTSPISDDIHALKYYRQLACGRDMGRLLAAEVERIAPEIPDLLIPVPLHWRRRLWRGFNQSVEIARPLSARFGVEIDATLVRRCVHTTPQVGLSPAERRTNLRRAFRCTRAAPPASVAIVDDVITSGSTVSEVARCLRAAGVGRIAVWALTRV